MCGIAAIVKRQQTPFPTSVLPALVDIVNHRGPDDNGLLWLKTGPNPAVHHTLTPNADWTVGLAHRRLSILDLSELGHQPMIYRNQYWIVYNGEVYNFLELRTELEQLGHTFRSDSDTEVILAAFMEWGPDCFARFHGMWGLVIIDTHRQQATLCRDRMGIKPLYVWRGTDVIVVASEIKQFTKVPGFQAKMEASAVREYLQTGYEFLDRTFFRDVIPVPAGHWGQIDLNTLEMGEYCSYWNPERIEPHITDITEAGRLFAERLRWSVDLHLRSDVPVGCALSGGLDSSSVVTLIDQINNGQTGEGLHTFTSTFPGEHIDEREFVDAVLAEVNASPHFVTPTPERFLEDFDRFLWIHDEPVGSFSVYASYAVARLAREAGIPVTLNGQGGDEIFAGYWQSYLFHLRDEVRQGHLLNPLWHLGGALIPSGNPALVQQVPIMLRRYLARRRPLDIPLRFGENGARSSMFASFMALSGQMRRVHEIRYIHLPRLLKWDDRNSMAFSVEGRYPFLDHSLIELCLSFDASILYHRGWTKWPLRVGLNHLLPQKIIQRRTKFGFLTPQERWINVALRPLLNDWVTAERPIWDYVERHDIQRLVAQVAQVQDRYEEPGQVLFRFFVLDRWLELFDISN